MFYSLINNSTIGLTLTSSKSKYHFGGQFNSTRLQVKASTSQVARYHLTTVAKVAITNVPNKKTPGSFFKIDVGRSLVFAVFSRLRRRPRCSGAWKGFLYSWY